MWIGDMTGSTKVTTQFRGGNSWTVTRKITIPMLRTTITTAVILRLISAIQFLLMAVGCFKKMAAAGGENP